MGTTRDGWDSKIPIYHGHKLTNYDNYDRPQGVCTHAALSYSTGIFLKTSAYYFSKETIDLQQHDEAIIDIIESLKYGNMLVVKNKC